MRLHSLLAVGSSILLFAACRDGAPEPSVLNNDLKRDLDAAASSERLQLANAAGDYQRARFVSPIEQTNRTVPSKQIQRPRPVVHASVGQTPEETPTPTESAANEVLVTESPSPEPAEETPASDEPRVPTVAPRPVAAPVDAQGPTEGARGGRGADAPPDIGTVVGVIMRGGRSGGDDHCVPRRRPGGRGFPGIPRILQNTTGLRPVLLPTSR